MRTHTQIHTATHTHENQLRALKKITRSNACRILVAIFVQIIIILSQPHKQHTYTQNQNVKHKKVPQTH